MKTRIQALYKVVSNETLCPKFRRLRLHAPAITSQARPGQFIHIRVQEGFEPFFRRPFSIYRAGKYLEIFYEVVGAGTRALSEKKKGDELDILGPLGRPFSMPPKGVRQVVMVAGGIGIAPFLFLTDLLKGKGYDLKVLYGGRTRAHVYPMKEFKQNGCQVLIATDDGSVGVKGRVPKLFSKIHPDPASTFLYTCGPNPMMAEVQEFARRQGLRGEAACEEVMACALGACLGCSIETSEGYKTVCHDGPVFDLSQIIFDKG